VCFEFEPDKNQKLKNQKLKN